MSVTVHGLLSALHKVLWAQVLGCLIALVYFSAATAQAEPSIARTFLLMWFGAVFVVVFMPLYLMAFVAFVWYVITNWKRWGA